MTTDTTFRAPLGRRDLTLIQKAIKEGWPMPAERRLEIVAALRASRPSANPRLTARIDEALAGFGEPTSEEPSANVAGSQSDDGKQLHPALSS
ncbi:MAG: hypothetical protein IT428_15735 [Planctomycetaceae bacterium]|nr:hypothetical protein [Planctomycetaceae bacterium]